MAQILLLSRAEVTGLLDADAMLDALAGGFRAISAGRAQAPARGALVLDDTGYLLTMPAFVPGLPIATKLVTDFPTNTGQGLPSHLATIVLLDATTGATVALMDGSHITAMRTAGAATLAAQVLARPESRTLTILGAGVQGAAHLELMRARFPLERILIGSRDRRSAEALAAADPRATVVEDFADAVGRSDIVCLCSQADTPLIRDAWVRPGSHVSSVGYAPPGGELDPAIASSRRLYVESGIAFAPPPAGCAELAGIDPAGAAELGEVLLGLKPGRQSAAEVTVWKAMGHAVEDLVVADLVYRRAVERSVGRMVEL